MEDVLLLLIINFISYCPVVPYNNTLKPNQTTINNILIKEPMGGYFTRGSTESMKLASSVSTERVGMSVSLSITIATFPRFCGLEFSSSFQQFDITSPSAAIQSTTC